MKRGEIALTAENVGRLAIRFADSGADLSFALREHAKTDEQATAALRVARAQQTGQQKTAPSGAGDENILLTDADLEDYMITGRRKHDRDAKAKIFESGESPILTTVDAIRRFIRSALDGKKPQTIVGYGKVGRRMAGDVAKRSNGSVDIDGYYLELDGSDINHLNDHVGTDDDPRNLPLSPEQAERLTEYIDQYDHILDVITRKDGQTRAYLSKDLGNGMVVVVEVISKGRRSLHPKTAWVNTYPAFLSTWGNKTGAAAAPVNVTTVTPAVDKSTTSRHPQSGQDAIHPSIMIAPGGKKVNRDAVGSKNQGAKNAASTNAVLAELQNASVNSDEDVAARLQGEHMLPHSTELETDDLPYERVPDIMMQEKEDQEENNNVDEENQADKRTGTEERILCRLRDRLLLLAEKDSAELEHSGGAGGKSGDGTVRSNTRQSSLGGWNRGLRSEITVFKAGQMLLWRARALQVKKRTVTMDGKTYVCDWPETDEEWEDLRQAGYGKLRKELEQNPNWEKSIDWYGRKITQ